MTKSEDQKKEATKEASRLHAAERNKNPTESSKRAKGEDKIAEGNNRKYNTTLSGQTIMQYVANGLIVVIPLKLGPDSGMLEEHFKLLLTAVKTYICISQIH